MNIWKKHNEKNIGAHENIRRENPRVDKFRDSKSHAGREHLETNKGIEGDDLKAEHRRKKGNRKVGGRTKCNPTYRNWKYTTIGDRKPFQ